MDPGNLSLIKAYTITELADLYEISIKTMKTWLRPHLAAIGEKKGRYFTTLQVSIIFEKIGWP